jgi:hypothetical protein
MSLYDAGSELLKSEIIDKFNRAMYQDIGYALADNPFIIEAIETAIQNEFPELFDVEEDNE